MTRGTALPRALLLDFYGTVVEEDDVLIARICEEIFRASPLAVSAHEVARYWSRDLTQLCGESFGPTFQTEKELVRLSLQRTLRQYRCDLDDGALSWSLYKYWARPTLFPESEEVLAQCKLPICLVSNMDNVELESALRHTNLHFEGVVSSEDCRAYKPRSELFERALALLHLSPKEVFHVGDSPSNDIRGAKAQGIPAVWVNRKQRPAMRDDGAPDYMTSDLRGLLTLVCHSEE